MQAQAVDRNAITVWRWVTLSTVLLIFISLLIPATGIALNAPALRVPLWIAALLLFTVLMLLVWWYPAAYYRHLGYRVDETGIVIQRGVFWRTQSAVPRVRIQHTDVSQGPLQRRYGVATLKLYTAGSQYTKVELPGLTESDAIALRDELQGAGDGDAV